MGKPGTQSEIGRKCDRSLGKACLVPQIVRTDAADLLSASDGDWNCGPVVRDQRDLIDRGHMVQVDQEAAVTADELFGWKARLDVLERDIGFMLYACIAVYDTFPVEHFDEMDL